MADPVNPDLTTGKPPRRRTLTPLALRGFFVINCAIGVLAVSVIGYVVMTLWNALVPNIFGLRSITFWQAVGLLILSKLLFGGFRPRPSGPHWRKRMRERWEHMTPEERERFQHGMGRRCGRARPEDAPSGGAEARA